MSGSVGGGGGSAGGGGSQNVGSMISGRFVTNKLYIYQETEEVGKKM